MGVCFRFKHHNLVQGQRSPKARAVATSKPCTETGRARPCCGGWTRSPMVSNKPLRFFAAIRPATAWVSPGSIRRKRQDSRPRPSSSSNRGIHAASRSGRTRPTGSGKRYCAGDGPRPIGRETGHSRRRRSRHRQAEGDPSPPSFPTMEASTLAFGERRHLPQVGADARRRRARSSSVPYDGPPFANGLPHYGHLLTGYCHDVVAATRPQRHRVEPSLRAGDRLSPCRARGAAPLGIEDVTVINVRWRSHRGVQRVATRPARMKEGRKVVTPTGLPGWTSSTTTRRSRLPSPCCGHLCLTLRPGHQVKRRAREKRN